jgi:late competence protein required for DNA uptake (superfamily II DNA/RNA helicase)
LDKESDRFRYIRVYAPVYGLALLKGYALSDSQMCIVTGPRIDLAIALIDRIKKLFVGKGLTVFDTKETMIELNNVKIEAFPSHHLDAMRGLPNVSFILLDEADFFPPGQQADARDVSERYMAKSNPYIVMVSTPNAPEGLFERIEKEAEDTCLYKRIFLDYTYGVSKIYTQEEIEKAKQSPSFEREYNLKYLQNR